MTGTAWLQARGPTIWTPSRGGLLRGVQYADSRRFGAPARLAVCRGLVRGSKALAGAHNPRLSEFDSRPRYDVKAGAMPGTEQRGSR